MSIREQQRRKCIRKDYLHFCWQYQCFPQHLWVAEPDETETALPQEDSLVSDMKTEIPQDTPEEIPEETPITEERIPEETGKATITFYFKGEPTRFRQHSGKSPCRNIGTGFHRRR